MKTISINYNVRGLTMRYYIHSCTLELMRQDHAKAVEWFNTVLAGTGLQFGHVDIPVLTHNQAGIFWQLTVLLENRNDDQINKLFQTVTKKFCKEFNATMGKV